MAEALNSETFETVATPKIKAKIEDEKVLKELFEELKLKSPSEELLKRFPYIRKNPCIRRVMVAVHELEYKLTKPSVCGCKRCTFCKYHVEMMLEEKYDDPPTTPDTTIYCTPNATPMKTTDTTTYSTPITTPPTNPVKNTGTTSFTTPDKTSVKTPDTTQTMTKDESLILTQFTEPSKCVCTGSTVCDFHFYQICGVEYDDPPTTPDTTIFCTPNTTPMKTTDTTTYSIPITTPPTNPVKNTGTTSLTTADKTSVKAPDTTQTMTKDESLILKPTGTPLAESQISPQAATPACKAVNVVFLLYCINCDEVLLGFTSEEFKHLADLSFGFHRDEKCELGKSHEKKYIRCMMIDGTNQEKSSEDETKRNEIISCIQDQNNDQVLIGILKNREVCHFSSIQKDTLSDDVNNKLSVWDTYLQTNKKYLIVKKYNESYKEAEEKYSSTPIPELDNWGLYRCYHHIPISNIKGLGTRARTFSYKSETIVYLKICYNCNIKYVGKTDKSILVRYRKALSSECTTSVEQHFDGEHECTFRDYRWTVMDALSDDQIYLLDKWRYVFNKCELDVRKKIWEQMNCDVNSVNKDLLEIVWQKNSIGEIIERIKEIEPIKEMELIKAMELLIPSSQNDTMNELDRKLEHSNSSNDDVETFLRNENEKWIEKTKALYLEEWEEYWMTELQTRENGLNVINSSKCKDTCPHFYIEFFKSLPNNDVEIPITDNVI